MTNAIYCALTMTVVLTFTEAWSQDHWVDAAQGVRSKAERAPWHPSYTDVQTQVAAAESTGKPPLNKPELRKNQLPQQQQISKQPATPSKPSGVAEPDGVKRPSSYNPEPGRGDLPHKIPKPPVSHQEPSKAPKPEPNPPSPPLPKQDFSQLSFDWSLPERYGLDANKNGRIDIPNTRSYVQNTDACPSETNEGDNAPTRFPVSFTVNGLPATNTPIITLKIQGENLSTPISKGVRHPDWLRPISVCLPEGRYEVELQASDPIAGSRYIRREITVEDFLIAVLGDSYASGEGNPEERLTFDINSITDAVRIFGSGELPKNACSIWADDGSMSAPPEIPLNTQQGIDHQRSHRSSIAAGPQLALELERQSPKWSVTLVHLAQSGATTNNGVLGTYKGRAGCNYSNDAMSPQLNELKSLVGSRKIDALIMSIGGNDAGFANTLIALLMREPGGSQALSGITLSKIERAIKTGKWQDFEQEIGMFGLVTKLSSIDTGLLGLPSQYRAIAQRLQLDYSDKQLSKVYLTEYPDFSTYLENVRTIPTPKPDVPDLSAYLVTGPNTRVSTPIPLPYVIKPHIATCDHVLNRVANQLQGGLMPDGKLEIGRGELNWARTNALEPLNRVLRQAANEHNWTFVDGILEGTKGHGLCVSKPYEPQDYAPKLPVPDRTAENIRFFRAGEESYGIQGSGQGFSGIEKNTGMVHPNEFGHYVIKEKIKSKMALPEITDREICNPCNILR